LTWVLLLSKLGISAVHNLAALRLVKMGFPSHLLAIGTIINFPCQVAATLFATRYTRTMPLGTWLLMYKLRLALGLVTIIVLYYYPIEELSTTYIITIYITIAIAEVGNTVQFVTLGAFFNKISDASMGGTYITLLNTLTNLGGTWPQLCALYFVDFTTTSECKKNDVSLGYLDCAMQGQFCTEQGGTCITEIDGFYVFALLTLFFGVWFIGPLKKYFLPLQELNVRQWIPRKYSNKIEDV